MLRQRQHGIARTNPVPAIVWERDFNLPERCATHLGNGPTLLGSVDRRRWNRLQRRFYEPQPLDEKMEGRERTYATPLPSPCQDNVLNRFSKPLVRCLRCDIALLRGSAVNSLASRPLQPPGLPHWFRQPASHRRRWSHPLPGWRRIPSAD